ncbi:hypothetical protein QTO34_006401 [Cnephaeus nilssonii]|uniref:Uncharacterized protein n=1 Tax=Cnephaeus nilssonii TaxID=3371016 RepID=A0AA40HLD5_CNENI|nr:hypothetical protein QTO34_006401 [Eptesicus nilssonii]
MGSCGWGIGSENLESSFARGISGLMAVVLSFSWNREHLFISRRGWRRLPLRNPGLRLLLLPRLLGGGGGGGGSGCPCLSATSTSACLPAGGVGGEGDSSSRRPPLPHKKLPSCCTVSLFGESLC